MWAHRHNMFNKFSYGYWHDLYIIKAELLMYPDKNNVTLIIIHNILFKQL